MRLARLRLTLSSAAIVSLGMPVVAQAGIIRVDGAITLLTSRSQMGPSANKLETKERAAETGTLHVTVESAGVPMADVTLYVLGKSGGRADKFETGHDGTRTVKQMPVGTYTVSAFRAGLIPNNNHVTIKAGKKSKVVIDLRKGSRIFGTVTDQEGKSVAGARVFLTRKAATVGTRVETEEDGTYELGGVTPGEYGVRVVHNRFKTWDRVGTLIFKSSGDTFQVDAELEQGTMISGLIQTSEGEPIKGATVMVTAVGGGGGGIATTDETGRFSVYGLLDRNMTVSARAAGYGTKFARNVPANTTDLVIRMENGGEITGTITAPGGIPDSFVVMLSRWDQHYKKKIQVEPRNFVRTENGAFRMPNVAPGVYWLAVHADGYEGLDEPEVNVQAGQTTDNVLIRLKQRKP